VLAALHAASANTTAAKSFISADTSRLAAPFTVRNRVQNRRAPQARSRARGRIGVLQRRVLAVSARRDAVVRRHIACSVKRPKEQTMKTMHAMFAMTSAMMIGGCADHAADEVTPLPPPMAKVERDGAKLEIYELRPGTLAVVATGDLPESIEGKSPVAIYETIAAERAPAELISTEARIAAARAGRTDSVPGSMEVGSPERTTIASLTESQFQSSWCDPGTVDFDYCFLSRTGTYAAWFYNIDWIHAHVNAYRGTITHAMWYRSGAFNWNLINFDTTTGSSYVSTFEETGNGDYEVSITDAAGDGYHLSMHGND
jgi:hypothetical protein